MERSDHESPNINQSNSTENQDQFKQEREISQKEHSQKAQFNLKFSQQAQRSKTGRAYNSDFIPLGQNWGNHGPKHSLQVGQGNIPDRDLFMEKSADWRFFGESQDNLEVRNKILSFSFSNVAKLYF